MNEITLDMIKAEYKVYMAGKSLNEYLKTDRTGAPFAMNRKQKKELFLAVATVKNESDWAKFLAPGGGCLEYLNNLEDDIHQKNDDWYSVNS